MSSSSSHHKRKEEVDEEEEDGQCALYIECTDDDNDNESDTAITRLVTPGLDALQHKRLILHCSQGRDWVLYVTASYHTCIHANECYVIVILL